LTFRQELVDHHIHALQIHYGESIPLPRLML